MKKLLYFLILQIFAFNCFSQETFFIKGKIESDSTLVKYVAIKLFQNNIPKQATITNEKGLFEFKNVEKGKYELKIISLFYEEKEFEVILSKDTDLGTIKLVESIIMLPEAEIRAEVDPVVPTDNGVVLNISDTKLNNYRDALSLISFAPVTFISAQNIQFESGGLEILINGKPINIPVEQQERFLQSISAQNIIRIEIIDKPDASLSGNKYGSVNIILKQDKGLSGSIEARGLYHKTFEQVYNASLFYNSKKLRLYSLFNIEIKKPEYERKGFEVRDSLIINKTGSQNSNIIVPNFAFGADYQINNKSSVGLLYSFLYENCKHMKFATKYNFKNLNDSLIYSESDSPSKYFLHTFTLSYNLQTDTQGSNFSTSFNYAPSYSNTNTYDKYSFFQKDTDTVPIQTIDYKYKSLFNRNIFSYDARHTQVFKNMSSLNFGAKLTYTDYNNGWDAFNMQNNEYKLDEDYSYILNFNEYLAAVFAGYRISYKKSSFSLSLRTEYNYNKYKSNSDKFSFSDNWAILPTFMHNISINKSNRIYYYFTEKTYRPNFNYYIEASHYSPISQSYGNANLKPQNSYHFSIGYVLKNKYNFSLQAYRNTNLLIRMPEIRDNDLIFNLLYGGYSNRISLNANLPFDIFDWWETSTNISGSFVNLDFSNNSNRYFSNGFSWNFYHSSEFSLTDHLWMSIDYSYTSKNETFFMKTSGYHNLGLAIGYIFDDLRVFFSVLDVLNTIKTNTVYNYFDILYGENNYKQQTSRTFRFGLVYEFYVGKKNNNFSTKESGIEEEKKRLKGAEEL